MLPIDEHAKSGAADLADQIENLSAVLTRGDLSTAEEHEQGKSYDCPLCGGVGEVDGETFTNFDGLALGVQFFGIGNEHVQHQKLWYAVVENLPLIVSALRALKRPEPSEADWRPIETAPRDGTWIMAWRPPCDGRWEPLVIVRWHEDEDGEGSWAWPDEAYDPYSEKGRTLAEGALDDGDCFWDNEHFTHWMPLPAAPALTQVEQADG